MMRKALAVSENPLNTRPVVPNRARRPSEFLSNRMKPVRAIVPSESRFSSAVRFFSLNASARWRASLLSSVCSRVRAAFRIRLLELPKAAK